MLKLRNAVFIEKRKISLSIILTLFLFVLFITLPAFAIAQGAGNALQFSSGWSGSSAYVDVGDILTTSDIKEQNLVRTGHRKKSDASLEKKYMSKVRREK